jgi:hypothetical protein
MGSDQACSWSEVEGRSEPASEDECHSGGKTEIKIDTAIVLI